jgi:thiamine biosynthesis protein ThiS
MEITVDRLQLTVNGEPHRCAAGATLTTLLANLGLDPRKLAVELNREIVPRATYPTVPLRDGDVLEIVHFIGGG